MRQIKFTNEEIYSLLKENETIAEEINKIVAEWEEVDKEIGKKSIKMDKIKQKMRPIIADKIKEETELGEFEVIQGVKTDGEEVLVEINDMVELYKEQLRKNNAIEKINNNEPINEPTADNNSEKQDRDDTETGSGEGETEANKE
jgi:hypothetical protein